MTPSITTMPLEFLNEICLRLDRPSLKCFRSTSTRLRDVSDRHFFRRVYAPLERDHRKLMDILSRESIKNTVKSVVFSKRQYRDNNWPTHTQEQLSDRQSLDATSETAQEGLQRLINGLQNLKEVTFLYGRPKSESTELSLESRDPERIKLASTEGGGGLHSSHVNAPRLYEDPEDWVVSFYCPEGRYYGLNEFMLIHNALTTSKAKIQLLHIINLGLSFFDPSNSISFEYCSLLTHLDLSLVDDENILQEGLKPILQTFEKLLYLRIYLNTDGAIPFDSVLESSFMWPHLKALCLGGFRSEEEDLKTMINGKIMSEIESLCLKKIQLTSGWEEVMCQDEVMGRESTLDLIKKKFTTYHLHNLPEFSEELSEGDCPFCVRWMET